jgi:hypothetical protein
MVIGGCAAEKHEQPRGGVARRVVVRQGVAWVIRFEILALCGVQQVHMQTIASSVRQHMCLMVIGGWSAEKQSNPGEVLPDGLWYGKVLPE